MIHTPIILIHLNEPLNASINSQAVAAGARFIVSPGLNPEAGSVPFYETMLYVYFISREISIFHGLRLRSLRLNLRLGSKIVLDNPRVVHDSPMKGLPFMVEFSGPSLMTPGYQ